MIMTQEEKARAYDEVLERAKEQIKECGDNEGRKKMIRNIFPELHESEDEKTRKALIQFLNDIKSISESGRTSWAVRKEDAEMCNGFITYLEKQKESKHAPDDLQKSFEAGQTSIVDNPEQYGLYKKTEWSEEDKDYYDTIVRKLEIIGDDCGLSNNQIKFLREHYPSYYSEWSEEDESELTAVIYCVSRAIKASENENERNSLLSAKKWLQDKLSFRVKSLRPSWKPSEEQMNCLCAAVDAAIRKHNESVSGYKLARVLKSLYEDLQKL